MEAEINQIQEKMNQQRQAAMEKAEERVQEITRNKTRKAALFEKEEKLAPPEDRAKLAAQHKIELKKLDEAVDENMLGRERDWQNRVNGWVLKAQRKIKAKEADDKAKAEKEMERKKRRRMRK